EELLRLLAALAAAAAAGGAGVAAALAEAGSAPPGVMVSGRAQRRRGRPRAGIGRWCRACSVHGSFLFSRVPRPSGQQQIVSHQRSRAVVSVASSVSFVPGSTLMKSLLNW